MNGYCVWMSPVHGSALLVRMQVITERLDKEKENYHTLQEASKKKLQDTNAQTKELIVTLKQRMEVRAVGRRGLGEKR